MYGPPTIPSTGGGWLVGPLAGMVLGVSVGSWFIALLSLLLIGMILFAFVSLRRGEKRLQRIKHETNPLNRPHRA